MSKEQISKAKERLRWFERRDEERARTDKAKNDFESIIYAMRAWLQDDDANLPYIGSAEKQEELLAKLQASEDWLLDGEGETATYVEYNQKHAELNEIFTKLKVRKEEHAKRSGFVAQALKRLEEIEDETKDLAEKKPWIKETERQEVHDRVKELQQWIEEQTAKQDA